ncbi:MAG: hypothetical protein HQK87_08460 [Nitrospinae bacterium]|nr:hypothetical protein [Nitrospinota bacterium]
MNVTMRVLSAAGGAAACGLALWAGLWGAADASARTAKNEVARWEQGGAIPRDADPDATLAVALRAVERDPQNGDYRMLVGKIHEWKAVAHPVWSSPARRERDEAVRWYRQTVALRPSDSLAWVSLAQSRFFNQRLDAETFGALERAGIFGPWEEVTQLKAAWLGMALWNNLPEPLKDAHRRSLQRMFMFHKLVYQLTVMAYQFDWLDELRGLTDDPRAHEVIERQVGWLKEGTSGNQY